MGAAEPPGQFQVGRRGVIARVVTDVGGIDKEFDYQVPEEWADRVALGTEVRIPLGGRRVGGWVTALPERAAEGVALRPIAKVRGIGPDPELVELTQWAAWRWAGKRAWFLKSASAPHAVVDLPAPGPRAVPARPPRTPIDLPHGPRTHLLQLAPAIDPTPLVAEAAQSGPTIVVVPTAARAAVLAGRLRRAGGQVALWPDDWVMARSGRAAVVVGPRSAVWAPCPDLSSIVVLDAHDEGLVAEGAPTWSAVTVAAERAARTNIPFYAVTPCPTLDLLARGSVKMGDRGAELAGWAITEVIDRRDTDPRLGLWSERIVQLVRDASPSARVACVLNRTGRVRLLACSNCGELARCEVCAAAVASPTAGVLHCPRCGHDRPTVCIRCDSTRTRTLRIGVARAREELEALAGQEVREVTSSTRELPDTAVIVGTEALLHRLGPASGVSAILFVDFDQELLAPRIRAAEEAISLLALASRLVRGRAGRVVIQTRMPEHPVVDAAVRADPARALEGQEALRRLLRFPPYAAVAMVHGDAAAEWVGQLQNVDVQGPDGDGRWLVKAPDPAVLCDALAAVARPPSGTLRVAVDPVRI